MKIVSSRCYKQVSDPDNWCPPYWTDYKEPLASVSFTTYLDNNGSNLGYRVSVWGADDFGMCIDFLSNDYEAAKSTFDNVILRYTSISVYELECIGFRRD